MSELTLLARPRRVRGAAGVERGADRHDRDLRRILDRHGRRLRRKLLHLCPRGVDVDDLEQEVVLRLWRALRRGVEIENLPAFLHRIAATATIDALRRRGTRREEPLAAAEESGSWEPVATEPCPERRARGRETRRRLRESLDALPENRRRAVALHLQGFTTREIGELLGWTEPKARNLVYRGMATLRLLMAAVAASLLLAVGLLLDRQPATAPSPAPVRGDEALVEPSPSRRLVAPPARLRWPVQPGATGYRVHLFDAAAERLWRSAALSRGELTLPPEAVAALRRGDTYFWTVEVLGPVAKRELGPFWFEIEE